jgi:hypothetical protein
MIGGQHPLSSQRRCDGSWLAVGGIHYCQHVGEEPDLCGRLGRPSDRPAFARGERQYAEVSRQIRDLRLSAARVNERAARRQEDGREPYPRSALPEDVTPSHSTWPPSPG